MNPLPEMLDSCLPLGEAMEGFYLQTKDGLFFAVKGVEHPPGRKISVLRYAPDAQFGDRRKGNTIYRRLYEFAEQERFLEKTNPQYLTYDPVFQTTLQSVPEKLVDAVYDPRKKYEELLTNPTRPKMENEAAEFLSLLASEAGVAPDSLGITGSLLIGLHNEQSDIDAVVFGTMTAYGVRDALQKMLDSPANSAFKRLDRVGLQMVYRQRRAGVTMDFDLFAALEKRKVNQGTFRGRPYFIRFVKNTMELEHESYGRRRYSRQGRVVLEALIVDDRDSIFTPCRYGLAEVRVIEGPKLPNLCEIVSFRGRFCEQARVGETIRASGLAERVEDTEGNVRHRLLLGNFVEDFLMVLSGASL